MAENGQSWTLEDLCALEKAIADGAQKVKYSDKEIEYRSLNEMFKIRAEMKKSLCLNKSNYKKGLFGGKRLTMKPSKGIC